MAFHRGKISLVQKDGGSRRSEGKAVFILSIGMAEGKDGSQWFRSSADIEGGKVPGSGVRDEQQAKNGVISHKRSPTSKTEAHHQFQSAEETYPILARKIEQAAKAVRASTNFRHSSETVFQIKSKTK